MKCRRAIPRDPTGFYRLISMVSYGHPYPSVNPRFRNQMFFLQALSCWKGPDALTLYFTGLPSRRFKREMREHATRLHGSLAALGAAMAARAVAFGAVAPKLLRESLKLQENMHSLQAWGYSQEKIQEYCKTHPVSVQHIYENVQAYMHHGLPDPYPQLRIRSRNPGPFKAPETARSPRPKKKQRIRHPNARKVQGK
jgi:hypothetical protein